MGKAFISTIDAFPASHAKPILTRPRVINLELNKLTFVQIC